MEVDAWVCTPGISLDPPYPEYTYPEGDLCGPDDKLQPSEMACPPILSSKMAQFVEECNIRITPEPYPKGEPTNYADWGQGCDVSASSGGQFPQCLQPVLAVDAEACNRWFDVAVIFQCPWACTCPPWPVAIDWEAMGVFPDSVCPNCIWYGTYLPVDFCQYKNPSTVTPTFVRLVLTDNATGESGTMEFWYFTQFWTQEYYDTHSCGSPGECEAAFYKCCDCE